MLLRPLAARLLFVMCVLWCAIWYAAPGAYAASKGVHAPAASAANAPAAASAAVTASSSSAEPTAPAISVPDALARLQKLQTEQDQIKQQTSTAAHAKQLDELGEQAQILATEIGQLIAELQPQRAQLQAQLDVLGPPPSPNVPPDTPAVAEQRATLDVSRAQLDAALAQASDEQANVKNLIGEFAKLRRNLLYNQLALRSGSILGTDFWMPLYRPPADDAQRFHTFCAALHDVVAAAWQPGQRAVTLLLCGLALAAWLPGRRYLERGFAWYCLTQLPDTPLRRSALALMTVLATLLATAVAAQLVFVAFTRGAPLPLPLQDLASSLVKVAITCAMISGLSRAWLCTAYPAARLPELPDALAHAMRPFAPILAGLLFVAATLEQLNRTADMSLPTTLLGRGIVSVVVALTVGAALVHSNRVRAALAAADRFEARTAVAGFVTACVSLAVMGALAALMVGYITVARFITYELVWFEIVLVSLYILSRLVRDVCTTAFSAKRPSGQLIKDLFNADDAHLSQASTLLSGIGTAVLLAIAVIALATGGLGTTPGDLLNSVLDVLGGTKLRDLHIVPGKILNAALAFGIGFYMLRAVRNWLDVQFLPTLKMDPGMRMSLVMLFTNIGYVLLTLLTLSMLGIRWDRLAWIVSALSVGIGFGLQEIVKNFVSGLILLTERPVKVGDLVSIPGVEGDIQRINVRATEIQLADRSIVIVPNSQLISQNLRNVTMGNSTLGVATLALTFPLNTDPEAVRKLLLGVYQDEPAILEQPAPSVTFNDLSPSGMTLSVTGYVVSPRAISGTKSSLLFEILKRLRAAGIPLATPQTLIVENPAGPGGPGMPPAGPTKPNS